MRYCILEKGDKIQFVSVPDEYINQMIALIRRLHKEVDKLTVKHLPSLPRVIGEFGDIEWLEECPARDGLDFIGDLEKQFLQLRENQYPVVALLTEIRALKAQLEHLVEEGEYY